MIFLMTQENKMDSVLTTTMNDDAEEGEILEDGEIADDDDDNTIVPSSTNINNNKESKENDKNGITASSGSNSKFGSPNFSSTIFPPIHNARDEAFFGKIPPGRRRRTRAERAAARKRKRSSSVTESANVSSKRKFSSSPVHDSNNAQQRELIDISQQLNDSSFDSVDLSDENEFNLDLIKFDVFMEIVGCKIDQEHSDQINNAVIAERSKSMLRILKIMKKLHGNDPDTTRRFARLKRRSREKQQQLQKQGAISNGDSSPPATANPNAKPSKAPCKFYLEGKCHKGSDCFYSHDIPIPKRKELCKFYLQGFCGKGDDCLFMHEEFPCKFFHTNTQCYANTKCRFSHKPLSDEMREVLRRYLDSGTFPDEVKPYRPINHPNDWPTKEEENESNENENHDFYDYDALLNTKSRPVLLGQPTDKMKSSMESWKWQQELKELEASYTGVKRNLFSIDDGLEITEKPPEEDDDIIEANIRNYYNDMMETDEYYEMMHLREMEEMELRLKQEEEERRKQPPIEPLPNPMEMEPPKEPELSEEEKRLIEASALDEDLRFKPQPFTLPPAFQNAAPGPVVGPPVSIPPPVLPAAQTSPFNTFNNSHQLPNTFVSNLPEPTNSLPANVVVEPKPVAVSSAFPGVVIPAPAPVEPNVPATIGGSQAQPQSGVPRDPRIRDPRLNNSNRLVANPTGTGTINSSSNNANGETVAGVGNILSGINAIPKSDIKVIKSNPNLVIKYKLIVVNVEPINYTAYQDLYKTDSSLKNDPRLKKFFSDTPSSAKIETTSGKTGNEYFSMSNKTSSENMLSSTTTSSLSSSSNDSLTIKKSPQRTENLKSLESSTITHTTTNDTNTTRDPRMIKSRDIDHRRSSLDNKNGDSNSSINSTSSTDQNKTELSDPSNICYSPEKNPDDNNSTSSTSIPSYALSVLPKTSFSFASVSTSGLGFGINNDQFTSANTILSNKTNDIVDDDDDDDDDDQLKIVDENHSETESLNQPISNNNTNKINNGGDGSSGRSDDRTGSSSKSIELTSVWPSNSSSNDNNISNYSNSNIINDSDNEMEIDLQSNLHQTTESNNQNSNNVSSNNNLINNESESEYENELVIATSSSETEDNTKEGIVTNSSNHNNQLDSVTL